MKNEERSKVRPYRPIVKLIIWLLLFLVSLLSIAVIFGVYSDEIDTWLYQKKVDYEMWKIHRTEAKHEALLKKDFDGGKTPEETLNLYLAALKAGDTVRASKYYQVDSQAAALKDLKDEKAKQGNLNQSINYVVEVKEKGQKTCKNDGCNFEFKYLNLVETTSKIKGTNDTLVIPKGGVVTKGIDLEPNKYTKVWKLIFYN